MIPTTAPSRLAENAVKAGYGVTKGTASNEVKAVTATTDKPAGIALNEGLASEIGNVNGDPQVGVVISGPCPAIAGASVNIDDDVVLAADGRLVAKSGAGYVVGKAMTAAAAGEAFTVFVNIRKEPA